MPYADPEKQKLYDKLKYLRNREKRLTQIRENELRNPAKYLATRRAYSRTHREQHNEYKRKWRPNRTQEAKTQERLARIQWLKDNPTKAKEYYDRYRKKRTAQYVAHHMMRAAVHTGYVVKPAKCEHCGAGGTIHGHHIDYSKVFDVEWLCHKCHLKAHNGCFHNPPTSITGRSERPSSESRSTHARPRCRLLRAD